MAIKKRERSTRVTKAARGRPKKKVVDGANGANGGKAHTVENSEELCSSTQDREAELFEIKQETVELEFGQPIMIGHGYYVVERETGKRHGAYATKAEAQTAYKELKKQYHGMLVFDKT